MPFNSYICRIFYEEQNRKHLHNSPLMFPTSSIAHKYRSLWTAGKELLQSACMLLSKVYFQEAYDSVDYKWTFLIPTHIAKLYFVHYKLYLRSPISINLHKKDVIISVIFYKVSYFKINIIFAFVTSNSLIHHVVTKTQGWFLQEVQRNLLVFSLSISPKSKFSPRSSS